MLCSHEHAYSVPSYGSHRSRYLHRWNHIVVPEQRNCSIRMKFNMVQHPDVLNLNKLSKLKGTPYYAPLKTEILRFARSELKFAEYLDKIMRKIRFIFHFHYKTSMSKQIILVFELKCKKSREKFKQ